MPRAAIDDDRYRRFERLVGIFVHAARTGSSQPGSSPLTRRMWPPISAPGSEAPAARGRKPR
jgi:hypothetical protein